VVDFGPDSRTPEGSHRAIASEVHTRSDADGLLRPVTRRNFIVWYLAGLLTALGLALIAPLLVYFYPPTASSKPKDVPIKLDKSLDDLGNTDAVKFEAPQETGFVMKDGGGDNAPGKIAFSGFAAKDASGSVNVFAVNCSHLGCSVAFNSGQKRFECPCHGSIFNIDGHVIHGPAVFPLSHLTWKQGPTADQIIVLGVPLKGIG
jgi:Rieske Fe-S protein